MSSSRPDTVESVARLALRSSSTAVTVAYASRFGATRELAEAMAAELRAAGFEAAAADVATLGPPPDGWLVVLTSVIWDRPIPAMREWIKFHRASLMGRVVAAGVVCGSAGVRPTGGLVYARQFVRRLGTEPSLQFALSGRIPPRAQLRAWEWWALKAFAAAMRRPELFAIHADAAGARAIAARVAAALNAD